jgi:hypothetical protein
MSTLSQYIENIQREEIVAANEMVRAKSPPKPVPMNNNTNNGNVPVFSATTPVSNNQQEKKPNKRNSTGPIYRK